jgi:putative ABC transport system permease protein
MSISVAGPRFSAILISAFSGMALLLAAIGLFGLVAYSVSQRLKEFGIRAALGAPAGSLAVKAMGSAFVLTVAGILTGLAVSIYLTRFVESQLYGIDQFDLPTFLGAGAVMLVASGVAAYLPARRAAQVDPMTALRYE